MLDVKHSALLDDEAKSLFPYINTSDFWGEPVVHTVARLLYHDRASKDCPLEIGFSGKVEFVKNQVNIVYVSDWFECSALKQAGKQVPAAGALRKFNIDCRAFINEELKSGVVVLLKDSGFQYLVSLFPQMTPWFFRERPLSDQEKELLVASLTGDSAKFNSLVDEFLGKLNLEARIKVMRLEKFVDGLLETKLKRLKEKETRILADIRNYEDRIRTLMEDYTETCSQILGVRTNHDDSAARGFAQVFATNKNCFLKEVSGSEITFVATGHLANFSKSAYETLSKTFDSCMYYYCSSIGISKDLFKLIMDELVLGKKYRINLSGKFKLNFGSNTYMLCSTNSSCLHENAIPNPHITRYQCAGGFAPMYTEAFRNGDYLEVLDIVFSEVQNLNWTDYSVIDTFMHYLCTMYWNKPCIWDKTEKVYISPATLADVMKTEVAE